MRIDRKLITNSLIFIYAALVVASNYVGDSLLHIFHFSYSSGTLIIQMVFSLIIIFTEIQGYSKAIKLIWATTLIHLIGGLLLFAVVGSPLPEFWMKRDIVDAEKWRQLNLIIMFSVGYACSTLAMVNFAGTLRVMLGKRWLLVRIILIMLAGLIVDMTVLTPIIWFVSPDRYMTLWNMLSLISVKLLLSLFSIPITYALIRWLKLTFTRFRKSPQPALAFIDQA